MYAVLNLIFIVITSAFAFLTTFLLYSLPPILGLVKAHGALLAVVSQASMASTTSSSLLSYVMYM